MASRYDNSSVASITDSKRLFARSHSLVQLISLLVIAFFGTLLNLTIFITIVNSRRLRMKATNVFVLSFSTSQLLVAGVLIPLYCFYQGNSMYDHLSALIVISYSTHLTAITYERLQSVKNSLRYHQIMPKKKAVKIVTSCWLVSLLAQLLPFTYSSSEHAEVFHKTYLVCILFIFLILPMIFLFYTYAIIFKELFGLLKRENVRRPSQAFSRPKITKENKDSPEKKNLRASSSVDSVSCSSDSQKSPLNTYRRYVTRFTVSRISMIKNRTVKLRGEIKLASVFAIVSATYILSWGPVVFMTFLEVIDRKDIEPSFLNLLSAVLIGINSVTDPIVYGLMLRDVRSVLAGTCKKKRRFRR